MNKRTLVFAGILIPLLIATIFLFKRVSKDSIDRISIQIGGEPSTLDPSLAIDQYAFGILHNTSRGLYFIDANGELKLGVASEHIESEDGLHHRFKIRSDAKWSDGQPVTSDDFVFGITRTLDPKTAAPSANHLSAIINARAQVGEKEVHTGVRSENGDLIIMLERPDPMLKYELTLAAALPQRKQEGGWNFKTPTNGDFYISQYKPSSEIELTPNPYSPAPAKSKIVIRILSEEVTAMNLFEAKRLDVLSTITSSEVERLRKSGLVKTAPSTTIFYLSFNHSRAPFNNPDWRKAIASSIDRDGLVKALRGTYQPTVGYLPTSLDGHLTFDAMNFGDSVAKINSLTDKPRIRLSYGASNFTKIVAEKLQSDFKNLLGIDVELEPQELKTLLGKLKSDPPDMYFLGMSAVYNDPMNQLNAFDSSSTPNFSRFENKTFNDYINQLRTEKDVKARKEVAEKANRLLVEEEVAVVPVVQRLQVFGVQKDLKGFKVNPYQVIEYKTLAR